MPESMAAASPPTEGTPLQQKEAKVEETIAHHHKPKVTTVELLGDLVFVVALKVSADALEAESALFPGVLVFMLRVFMLWNLWHFGTIIINLSVRLDDDGEMNLPDYFAMFAILGTTIFMARAIGMDNDLAFVSFYLCIRGLQALYAILRIDCRECPEHVSVAHYKLARRLSWGHLALYLVAEVPALVAALFFHDLRDGSVPAALEAGAAPHHRLLSAAPESTVPPSERGLMWMVLVAALIWLVRFPMAVVTDCQRTGEDDQKSSVLDTEHLAERYELIILIFIGEMVFAAALPGSALLSMCCCMVLILCYLLYFRTRPVGVELSWSVSYTRQMLDSFVHMALFCALGGLGAGYGLLIHHEATFHLSSADASPPVLHSGVNARPAEPHHEPHSPSPGAIAIVNASANATLHPSPQHEGSASAPSLVLMDEEGLEQAIEHGNPSSCFALELLCISAAAFLIASSLSIILGKDPEHTPLNLPSGVRFAVRTTGGLCCGALFFALDCDPAWHVAASIPAIMCVCVTIESFGVKSRGWPFATAAKPAMRSV